MKEPTQMANRQGQSGPDRFVSLFMSEQRRLLTFATVLLGDVNDAEDVLSEATMVMWRKFDEFEPGSDFNAWASRIIRYKVLEHHRRRRRGGFVMSDAALAAVADDTAAMRDELDAEFRALAACLNRLSESDRQLLMRRYQGTVSVNDLAASVRRSTVTLRKMLSHLRGSLLRCIKDRLAEEPRP